jgi:hypothetical protein
MTTNPTIPSRSPADSSQLSGLLSVAIRKTLEEVHCQLPAKVISYNRATNRAMVQPLINVQMTSGEVNSRAQIASVPVLALGGGGFCMTFPLAAGDIGWLEASDRDISLFMQSLSESKPNTFRIHDFSDARFIPDAFYKYTFPTSDSGKMVIQSYDGTVKITLSPNSVDVEAPTQITMKAPTVNITAATLMTLNAAVLDLQIGALSMTDQSGGSSGTASISIPVNMTDGCVINGVTQQSHKHTGVQTGPGTSGGPTN